MYSLAVQADGKILVGGEFTTLGGQTRNYIGRLNADGTLDSELQSGGEHPCVIRWRCRRTGRFWWAAFHHAGRADAQLHWPAECGRDAGQRLQSGGEQCVCIRWRCRRTGRFWWAAYFTTLGGQPRNYIARLNAGRDAGHRLQSGGGLCYVYSLAVQADGKILVGGNFTTLGGQPRNHIGRLNADGTLDSGFNPGANSDCVFAGGAGGREDSGGRLFHHAGRAAAQPHWPAECGRDAGQHLQSGGELSRVYSLAVQADGKILVGGAFTTLGGQPRNHIGRLNNTEPATQSLSYDGSTITWLRGGTSPEVWRTTFEHSTDGADLDEPWRRHAHRRAAGN